jgi:hypothetical protein
MKDNPLFSLVKYLEAYKKGERGWKSKAEEEYTEYASGMVTHPTEFLIGRYSCLFDEIISTVGVDLLLRLVSAREELDKRISELENADSKNPSNNQVTGESELFRGIYDVVYAEDVPEELRCMPDTDCWVLVTREREGDRNSPIVSVIAWDGGEPEDQTLVRDWSWVTTALWDAYRSGIKNN